MIDLIHRLKIKKQLATNPIAFFESLNQLSWYQQTLRTWVGANNIATGRKILEVGCATGTLSRYISNLKHEVTGVDLSEGMIKAAQTNAPHISFLSANVYNLPFENNAFDLVICASLLNIVSDKEQAVKEMARVCKNGGEISVLVPLKGFNDAKLNPLISSLNIKGFSSGALKTWHKLAPKMSILEVNKLFGKYGLKTQTPTTYLDGMVFSVTANKAGSKTDTNFTH